MNFVTMLPMAVVMVSGTPIIGAVFLATSRQARRASVSYLAGAAIAVLAGVSVAYWAARILRIQMGPTDDDPITTVIDSFIIVLLLALMVIVFRRRHRPAQPRWLRRLETATPRLAFGLGVALFLLVPADIIIMLAVGGSLARHDRPWWEVLPFVSLTLLLLALPLLVLVALGRRAEVVLPRIRRWIKAQAWLVSEVVIAFFIVLVVVSQFD